MDNRDRIKSSRRQPTKPSRRRPIQKLEKKEIKSIWMVNNTFRFNEKCYSEWLNKFSKIVIGEKEYELDFDENEVNSCMLGQGGNGFVFKYKYKNEEFAIKFLTNKDNRNKEVVKIKAINSLFHGEKSANYRVTRFIEEGDQSLKISGFRYNLFFIVMDLADGTIKNLMCDHFQDNVANLETSDLLMQIKHLSETIEVLHNSNFAHRDIKPENILLKGNLPILADFGLSSSCTLETIRQKGPKYWPNPEFIQACDKELQKIDTQSDIFNLGCLFFYFFTKKYPIGLVNIEDELDSLNDDIKNKIIHMINYKKEDRLENISELITVLDRRIAQVSP